MTDEQKRADKAALLLEFSEATGELAALKERAHRIASSFRRLADVLTTHPERYVPAANMAMPMPGIPNRLGFDPSDYVTLTPEQVLDVCRDIREAEKHVEILRQRKQNLGLA